MPTPWNDWYHCMSNTYGTWLPGDPRGYRTRHHRQHVEGDYKNPPPPGAFGRLHTLARQSMKREAVHFTREQVLSVLTEIVASFQRRLIQIIMASLDDHHLHLLARFPDRRPRHWVGIAKKESSHFSGLGPIWAVRGKIVPIRDRQHQLNVAQYIVNHSKQGAAIWRAKSPGS